MTGSWSTHDVRLEILTCDSGSIALDSVLVSWRLFEDSRIGPPVFGGRRVFRWASCGLLLEPDATSEVTEPNPVSMVLDWYVLSSIAHLRTGVGQCHRNRGKFSAQIQIVHSPGNVEARSVIAVATWRLFPSAMACPVA